MSKLNRAIDRGDVGVVKQLLDSGADVNSRIEGVTGDSFLGGTILHRAAHYGHFKLVELLLDRGADVNARDSQGETPLHAVVQQHHPLVVKLLLDRGALVNAKDKDGDTPLHSASIMGDAEVVTLLLNRRADPNARNRERRTPLQAARDCNPGRHKGHDEVIRALKVNGAWFEVTSVKQEWDSIRQQIQEKFLPKQLTVEKPFSFPDQECPGCRGHGGWGGLNTPFVRCKACNGKGRLFSK